MYKQTHTLKCVHLWIYWFCC